MRLSENYEELIYDVPEVLIPEDHEEHIDFTVKLDIDKIMLEEPAAESERIGLAAETDADNRDKITDCDLTPSPAWSPDDYGDRINGYPEAEITPIEVEDDEDNGEMHAEEPNLNETGIPTEFVYTLQDTTVVKRLRPSQLTKMIQFGRTRPKSTGQGTQEGWNLGTRSLFTTEESLGSLRWKRTSFRMSEEKRRLRG